MVQDIEDDMISFSFSCLFRIVDSFGTEPAYNHRSFAKQNKILTSWGGQDLQPRQFFTMFRKYQWLFQGTWEFQWLPCWHREYLNGTVLTQRVLEWYCVDTEGTWMVLCCHRGYLNDTVLSQRVPEWYCVLTEGAWMILCSHRGYLNGSVLSQRVPELFPWSHRLFQCWTCVIITFLIRPKHQVPFSTYCTVHGTRASAGCRCTCFRTACISKSSVLQLCPGFSKGFSPSLTVSPHPL